MIDTSIKTPYISINKLAEYMQADSIRRRTIIRNLKKDKPPIKQRYYQLRNVIKPYFTSHYDKSILDMTIDQIREEQNVFKEATSWKKGDMKNTVLAIEALKQIDLPNLENYDIVNSIVIDSVELAKVKVTIKPEIVLINKKTDKIGAIKIHISKTKMLDEHSRRFAATMLKYSFLNNGYESKKIEDSMCLSIEVFDKCYSVSPKTYKRSINSLEASCEEIYSREGVS